MSTTISPAPTAPRTSTAARPGGRVLLLEFNELCPTLMDEFIAEGRLPNFKRLRDASQVFTSDAQEVPPNLEPWIQWITVHCGLSFNEHGIFHLADGHKLDTPQVWDLASTAGKRVWVCGSMNVRYDTPLNGKVLPDPWATGSRPYPEKLFAPYFTLVQRYVQEYTNDRVPVSLGDFARFGAFMATHGLSASTVIAVAKQLLRERTTGRFGWQRAAILDRLQFDVFRHFWQKDQPHFATFFLNSTAHLQHMHWRNMDPTPFKVKPTDAEQAEFESAIRWGYEQMDAVVGRTLEMVDANTTVILSSALSQQPCLIYEDLGGKTFYRPREFDRVLDFAGVERGYEVAPVMSEQFHIHFPSEAAATAAADKLRALRIDDRQVLVVDQDGTSIFSGCRIFDQLDKDSVLSRSGGQPLPFFRLFYQVEGLKSGMHHNSGILWFRIPGVAPARHDGLVPLSSVAPTLTRLLGLQVPEYMREAPLLSGERVAA